MNLYTSDDRRGKYWSFNHWLIAPVFALDHLTYCQHLQAIIHAVRIFGIYQQTLINFTCMPVRFVDKLRLKYDHNSHYAGMEKE